MRKLGPMVAKGMNYFAKLVNVAELVQMHCSMLPMHDAEVNMTHTTKWTSALPRKMIQNAALWLDLRSKHSLGLVWQSNR